MVVLYKLNEVHDGRLQVTMYALSEELCCGGGAGPRGTGTATRTFEAPLLQHFQTQGVQSEFKV